MTGMYMVYVRYTSQFVICQVYIYLSYTHILTFLQVPDVSPIWNLADFRYRYRRSDLQYPYITISKVQPSISKVGNDLRYRVRYYNSISKVLTFDIDCLKSD